MKQFDFTKMAANSKIRLITCPECGLTGLLHKYTDGSAMIEHKSHIEMGMFNHIDSDCYIKAYKS